MSSWLSWAQEAGQAAMDAIQEDLGQFATVVSEDTAAAAEEAHALAQAQIAKNLAKISIDSIQQSLDELDTYIEDSASANADDKEYFTNCRLQKMEDVLIRNEQTFLSDPAAAEDAIDFVEWLEGFELEWLGHSAEAEQLLKDKPDLFRHHIEYVPAQLTNQQFWTRFFWGRHKIRVAEARRSAILEKAANQAQASEEEEGWGTSEDDEPDVVETADDVSSAPAEAAEPDVVETPPAPAACKTPPPAPVVCKTPPPAPVVCKPPPPAPVVCKTPPPAPVVCKTPPPAPVVCKPPPPARVPPPAAPPPPIPVPPSEPSAIGQDILVDVKPCHDKPLDEEAECLHSAPLEVAEQGEQELDDWANWE